MDSTGTVGGYRRGQVPRAVREGQLLDVAEELFSRHGYSDTSIEQIARAAGVSRPIVYEHFGSKDGIYLACLIRARAELEAAMFEAAASTEDLSERLWRGIDAWFGFIEDHPKRWGVLFGGVAVSGPAAEEARRLRFRTVEAIAVAIGASVPDAPYEQVEAFAHCLSGAGEQLTRWWLERGISRRRAVDYLHQFAWAGLSQLI